MVLAPSTICHAIETKPRIAVQHIDATPAVMARAQGDGTGIANVLRQILQAANGDLVHALQRSGQFEVTAGTDLRTVLDAQDLQDSGLYGDGDKQRSTPFELAPFTYIANVRVKNFQVINREDVIADAFGNSTYLIETIQLGADVRLYDVTKGTLLTSASVQSSHTHETRIIEGATQDGSFSNAMIAKVSRDFAGQAVSAVLDALSPPTIIEFDDGRIWFNRGEGTGIAVGDVFSVRDPGDPLLDPHTGAELGWSDVRNGWAVVTELYPSYTVAEAVSLTRAPAIGHSTMRPADALPAPLTQDMRATGPFAPAAPPPTAPTNTPAANSAQANGHVDVDSSRPVRVALFVDTTAEALNERQIGMFERQLGALLSREGVRVISRRDVLNAASTINGTHSNSGTGETSATHAQRLLSDRASVVALAQMLNADAIVTATVTAMHTDLTQTKSVDRAVTQYTIDVSWNVLESQSGLSADGGIVHATERVRESPGRTRVESNIVARLLEQDAQQIATAIAQGIGRGVFGPRVANASTHRWSVVAVLENMTVPEIQYVDGHWTVTGSRYPLSANACTISLNGLLVGSTPGPIQSSLGVQRMQLEHPLCKTVDRYVRIDDTTGTLRIPIVLSADGRAAFEQQTAFFEQLKDGAVLRENERAMVQGLVDFLKRSSVTIDTSQVRNLGIGQPSIWLEQLE
jgi:hypothetical protein